MTTIGAGWKRKDKNNDPFISWEIDEALLPLTIDKGKKLNSYPVKEKKSEKSPDFRLEMFVPKNQNTTNSDDEEMLF